MQNTNILDWPESAYFGSETCSKHEMYPTSYQKSIGTKLDSTNWRWNVDSGLQTWLWWAGNTVWTWCGGNHAEATTTSCRWITCNVQTSRQILCSMGIQMQLCSMWQEFMLFMASSLSPKVREEVKSSHKVEPSDKVTSWTRYFSPCPSPCFRLQLWEISKMPQPWFQGVPVEGCQCEESPKCWCDRFQA